MELDTSNIADRAVSESPKYDYIVWIDPENYTSNNIGKSETENTKKASVKPSIPFNVKEEVLTSKEGIFLNYPIEMQIPRTPFSQLRERLFNTFNAFVNQYYFSSTKETNG